MTYRSYWRKAPDAWVLFHSPGHELPEGQIADLALWNAPLTTAEVRLLVKGVRPRQVAPDKLLEWYPLNAIEEFK